MSRKFGVLLALEGERLEGIDDDARQAGRVEHALLEVELPGPVLLGEQPALQPVGEPADHALEVRELLVEIGAQPRRARRRRRDPRPATTSSNFCVKALVVRPARLVRRATPAGARPRRPPRASASSDSSGISPEGASAASVRAFLEIVRVASSEISISARSPSLCSSASPSLCPVSSDDPGRPRSRPRPGRAGVVGHVERGEEVADASGRTARWFSIERGEAVEVAPGAVLDEIAPELDDLGGGRRRLEPGQALAHHQRDRVLDRRVGAVGDVLVFAAAMVAVLEHGRDVVADARHAPRADRLDAGLLHGIEHGAGGLALRREPAMHRARRGRRGAAPWNRRGRARLRRRRG